MLPFQGSEIEKRTNTVEEKYGPSASVGDEDEDEDEDESDSESDESEDEDGEELTPAVDAAILRTLARIKKRDPGIYEAGRDVFTGEWDCEQHFTHKIKVFRNVN